jgi:hypothetical protein
MADYALCLNCLIEGEYSIFIVKTTGSMKINALKELILEKGIETERTVLAKNLTLWKVSMSMASDNTSNSPVG